MKLIITIDTEEDNWGDYSAENGILENIERIPYLQQLFDDFNVKPTYLITYPVATNEKSISTLRKILEEGRCEVGTHCHPWNTPPFKEENNTGGNMLNNLSIDIQYNKLDILHQTISKNFNIEPTSFRSGGFGYNQDVARNLFRLGYKIDTSISPYTDWTHIHGPDFSDVSPKPFRFSSENIFKESSHGHLVEIPVTIGFFQQNFASCNAILKRLSSKPLNRMRLVGLLYRLNLLNKVWLSPEVSDSRMMIKLVQCMRRKNYGLINMVFHSPSLKAGLTPFVRTKSDEVQFFQRIKEFLIFARDAGIESITLMDALGCVS